MNPNELVEIANAKNHVDIVLALNQQFLDYAKTHGVPRDVPTELKVTSSGLQVAWYSYVMQATPRVVRSNEGKYLVEYVFSVEANDDRTEIWRFYLTSMGRLTESLEDLNGFCDYNNTYLASHLCGRAALGLLRSAIYSPAPRADG